jgi:hypothetical protein
VKRVSERKEKRGALVVRRQPVRCRTCHHVHSLSTLAQVGVRHASTLLGGCSKAVSLANPIPVLDLGCFTRPAIALRDAAVGPSLQARVLESTLTYGT